MAECFIYGLVDPRTNELRYVGQTSRGMLRPQEHSYPCLLARDTNSHKANWIRALHREGHEVRIDVLEVVDRRVDLNARETYWIRAKMAEGCRLLNVSTEGYSRLGYAHSEKTKAKMRGPRGPRKTPMTAEHKAKVSATKRGVPLTMANRQALSTARKGRTFAPLTPEHRLKMAKAHGGRPFKDQHGTVYESTRAAARSLSLDGSAISKVLRRKIKHTGGFVFRWLNDATIQMEEGHGTG